MQRQMLLAKANLRHEKGQVVVLIALILIASLLMNLWLMLAVDYHANFDRWHDELHAEDVLVQVALPVEETEAEMDSILADIAGISESDVSSALTLPCTYKYNEGSMTGALAVLTVEDATARPIGRVQITEEDDAIENGLYFPMIYESSSVPLGGETTLSFGDGDEDFPVKGFFNSVMAGSHNCSVTELLATDDTYEELKPYGMPSTLVAVRTDAGTDSREVEGEIMEEVAARFPNAYTVSTNYARVRQSRYISQMISSAILGAAAMFVLLVAIVVASSNTVNHIQQVMPDLGVLKGLGYTGKELMGTFFWQETLLSLPAGLTGAALAYTVFPLLSEMMSEQTGIPYAVHFLLVPFLASSVLCWAAVALSAWLASRPIRSLEPITALRSGIKTHNFKHNACPLDRSRGSVQTALAWKNCVMSGRRNAGLCATMAVLTLLVVFACVMVRNVVIDPDPMLDLIGIERADLYFVVNADAESELVDTLKNSPEVEKYYLYHQDQEVTGPDGSSIGAIVMDDCGDLDNPSVLYEGRFPLHDNETVLGAKLADSVGVGIGDTVQLGGSGTQQSYLVVGLTQGSNYLGEECWLTRDGYERIKEPSVWSYYVNLQPDTDAKAFIDDMKSDMGSGLQTATQVGEAIEASSAIYVVSLTAMVWVLVILTIVLAALILALVSRTVLRSRFHEFGILKALGYTTGNLVGQTVMSFLPVLAVAEVCGLVVWSFLVNPLMTLFLRGIGTQRCNFIVPGGMIAGAGAALLAFALLVIGLMAIRIRRINPAYLLAQE